MWITLTRSTSGIKLCSSLMVRFRTYYVDPQVGIKYFTCLWIDVTRSTSRIELFYSFVDHSNLIYKWNLLRCGKWRISMKCVSSNWCRLTLWFYFLFLFFNESPSVWAVCFEIITWLGVLWTSSLGRIVFCCRYGFTWLLSSWFAFDNVFVLYLFSFISWFWVLVNKTRTTKILF